MAYSTSLSAGSPSLAAAVLADALADLERGVFARADALAEETADGPLRAALELALVAHAFLAGEGRTPPPLPEALDRFEREGSDARAAAASAAAAIARAAVLAWDPVKLLPAETRLAGLAPGSAALAVARGWRAEMTDDARTRREVDPDLRAIAGSQTPLGAEAGAIGALAALRAGDLERAVTAARAAARTAQAAGAPAAEYLAHLVLARVRRIAGRPHLATRILSAMAAVAPAPFRPWIAWERALAPGDPLAPAADDLPIARLVAAAALGDRPAFAAAGAEAAAEARGFRAFAEELQILRDGIDPAPAAETVAPALASWCSGTADETPLGLFGVGAALDLEGAPGGAFVLAGPGRRPRRFLRPGLGLVDAGDRVLWPARAKRHPARVDTAIAALALAGPEGMGEAEFFRAVYRFRYTKELHLGTLDVLLHRLRQHLGEDALVERERDTLRLLPARTLVVPDPRCAPPIDHRVLGLLATRGETTAKEASSDLDIPLRTIQTALKELVADGVVKVEGRGPKVVYRIEDTTFADPDRR